MNSCWKMKLQVKSVILCVMMIVFRTSSCHLFSAPAAAAAAAVAADTVFIVVVDACDGIHSEEHH